MRFLGFLLLIALFFINPFSRNNSISDLYPWPDSFGYLTPVKSLFEGNGMKLTYEGRLRNPDVPPLYSISIIPFYFVFRDVRAFYFDNILLCFISVILIYRITRKLNLDPLIQRLVFFAYITNYIIFWWPSFAMAENLLLPLFLTSVLTLMLPVNIYTILLTIILAASFYMTKYAAFTLSVSLGIAYLIKITRSKENPSTIARKLLFFLLFGLLSIFAFAKKEYPLLYFSPVYFKDNFTLYMAGLMGGPTRIIGLYKSMVIPPIGIVGLTGLVVNLFFKRNRLISFYFFLSVITSLLFISTFYSTDARYLFVDIPILILSFGIFLNLLFRAALKPAIIIVSFVWIILSSLTPIREQLNENFFKPQASINYAAIENLNNYFSNQGIQKPVVITALPPYLVDLYSNHNYELLPFSPIQPFADNPQLTWGKNDYSDYTKLYKSYLFKNVPLYYSDIIVRGNFFFYPYQLKLEKNFKLIKVAAGCDNQCNIYQIKTI